MGHVRWPDELRVVLSNTCNYRCLFCHEEGQHEDVLHSTISPHLWETVRQALDSGISDVTFTGGEPLLHKETLLSHIYEMNRQAFGRPERITIVTNASLLDDEFSRALSAHGNVTLNVSIHTFDSEKYRRVTGQTRFSLQDILAGLGTARRHGVEFKVNAVLLKEVNNSREEALSAIRGAIRAGARAIKFIELLVPNDKDRIIPHYYELDSLTRVLGKDLELEHENARKKTYRWRGHEGFRVEMTRCTCAVGCARCLEFRFLQINGSNEYQPCFVSIDRFPLGGMPDLEAALTHGNRKLAEFGRLFGDRSPILNNRIRLSPSLSTVFCEADEGLYSLLEKRCTDYNLERIRFVDQEYVVYMPRTADSLWKEFRKVLRIRRNQFNREQEALILSHNEYGEQGGLFFSRTEFARANEFFLEDAPERLHGLLEGLDFQEVFAFTRRGYQFMDLGRPRVQHEISRLNIAGAVKVIYSCTCGEEDLPAAARLVREFGLRVIGEPFFGYLRSLSRPLPRGDR